MKSFLFTFLCSLFFLGSVFTVGYALDTVLQKNVDIVVSEGQPITVSDHRSDYPNVTYSWYIDGKPVSGAHSAGLLMDWSTLETLAPTDHGNNTITRPVERIMKDDYRESKEYIASLVVKNIAPTISMVALKNTTIDDLFIDISCTDPAVSDYPLDLTVQVLDTNATPLYTQNFSVVDKNIQQLRLPNNPAWCNTSKIISFTVKDDLETVTYQEEFFISCPISSIYIPTDPISQHIYMATLVDTSSSATIASESSLDSIFSHTFNTLFSKGFLQAILTKNTLYIG